MPDVDACVAPANKKSGSFDTLTANHMGKITQSTVWRRLFTAARRFPRRRREVIVGGRHWWRRRRRRRPRQEGEVDRDEEDVALHGRRRQAAHSGRAAQGWILPAMSLIFSHLKCQIHISNASIIKGKDMKEYSSQDYFDLDDHYQRLCNQQKEFVIWEGPLEGRRVSERRIFVSNEWLLKYIQQM